MSKEKYKEKFILKIGKRILFGIIKKEVTVYKTKIIFNKNEDDIE